MKNQFNITTGNILRFFSMTLNIINFQWMLLIYINKQVLVSTSGSVIHGRCTPVLSDIPDK